MNPDTNVNDCTDDTTLRLPDTYSLDAQVAFNFQPLIGARLEAFIDALNVLDQRITTSVTTNDGPRVIGSGSASSSTSRRGRARAPCRSASSWSIRRAGCWC